MKGNSEKGQVLESKNRKASYTFQKAESRKINYKSITSETTPQSLICSCTAFQNNVSFTTTLICKMFLDQIENLKQTLFRLFQISHFVLSISFNI